jgi:co-chaperonin GroES (HSP10)
MQPLADNILIRPDEPKTKTDSGIFIKEDWETREPIGTVESIGDDVTDVKAGDRVVFMRYGSVQTPDKDLRLVKQSHIMAKINA